ncbi:prolyl-tRNA synthetase associated domain-containing protein [Defluviitalea phaphyphila]|uniref:prolyl-tRNA synthetase associated domain-containing protein n=1 Tax=Defluviitalea phaphyphila TaxID=1473580 RepID=UPI0007300E03|nr:prolyl-tRNA synthetase associated domain-containing protein [Defluviitalea phaphyphila]
MTKKVQEVCDLLNNKGINFNLVEHKAVYTIDEMLELNLPDADVIAKNLFLRDNKKRNYYLLVVCKDKRVNLKALKEKLCSKPLSFASEKDLESILGLSKGSVTPFGIINDKERKVKVIIDNFFKEKLIGVHPNENTATVWLNVSDLVEIIKEHGNFIEFLDI